MVYGKYWFNFNVTTVPEPETAQCRWLGFVYRVSRRSARNEQIVFRRRRKHAAIPARADLYTTFSHK
jgi:hypothetical protein